MKTMKNLLLAVFLFGGSFVMLLLVSQNVEVTSPLFPVKRMDESLILLTKRTPDAKIEYYQELIQKRFSDISYVVKTDHRDILVAVSLRYSTTVGRAVQLASAYDLRKALLKAELETQKKVLQKIVANYESNDRRQIYIEDDINYINTYEKQL
jgi:hypothetical protein